MNVNVRKAKKYEFIIFFVFGILLILIAGMRLFGHGADYDNYADMIVNKIDPVEGASEIGFKTFIWINDFLFDSKISSFLVMFAILGVGIKLFALLKYSKIPLLSFFLYILSYFLLHEYVQIRAGVATGFFLLAIPDLASGNFRRYLVKTIFAMLFHWSSVILIPLYFVVRNIKLSVFYILPFIGLFIFLMGLDISSMMLNMLAPIDYFREYYLFHSGHQATINAFNLLSDSQLVLFVFIGYLLFIRKKIKSDFNISIYKIFSVSIFLFYILAAAQLPVLAFRISEYLNVVLLFLIPAIVAEFKDKIFISSIAVLYFMAYCFHLIVNVNVIPELFYSNPL